MKTEKLPPVAAILNELSKVNVPYHLEERGNNKVVVRWRVSPEKEQREVWASKFIKDPHAVQNNRSDTIRFLKHDIPDYKERVLAGDKKKAKAPPPPEEELTADNLFKPKIKIEDIIQEVQEKVGIKAAPQPEPVKETVPEGKPLTLEEKVTALFEEVKQVRALLEGNETLMLSLDEKIEKLFIWAAPKLAFSASKEKGKKREPIIGHVGMNWEITDAIALRARLPKDEAYRKLYYLFKKGKVQMSEGKWRKTPKESVLS